MQGVRQPPVNRALAAILWCQLTKKHKITRLLTLLIKVSGRGQAKSLVKELVAKVEGVLLRACIPVFALHIQGVKLDLGEVEIT